MNAIRVMAQGFYGNRTVTDVRKENVDRFILGYMDDALEVKEKIDRTIVHIPNSDNVVIVYNKYEEEIEVNPNPLVIIPENNIKIYSRCIACRMNEDGELESLEVSDLKNLKQYLAE
jgi:hypothetical protein